MTTYYNENDPFAAAWLRNLMKKGLIYDGEVDERSIADVRAADLKEFTACHFFAGIGGWDHALDRAGWPAGRKVWTGSCPCQPFSLAGRQAGFDDERHLWPIWRNLIEECRPATVFGEQVASATTWLGLVRSDLEALGYAVGAIPLQAASAGAYHLRDRYWFVADSERGAGDGRTVEQEWRQEERAAADGAGPLGVADSAGERQHGGKDPAWQGGRGGLENGGAVVNGVEPGLEGHAGDGHPRAGRPGSPGPVAAAGGELRGVADAEKPRREQPAPQADPGAGGRKGWNGSVGGGGDLEWVVGADGKARRVEPGIRLLANGVPNRVGKLRGFGNAIDPRPAQAFIEAFMASEP